MATGSRWRSATFSGDVQRQRRFSHRRARRKNDQLGWLQAGRFVVEPSVARGEARDPAAFAEDFFEALEIFLDKVLDADQSRAHAIFRELEDADSARSRITSASSPAARACS